MSYLMETSTTSDTSPATWYRTTKFSRRGPSAGFMPRKASMGPRSAATAGSASGLSPAGCLPHGPAARAGAG